MPKPGIVLDRYAGGSYDQASDQFRRLFGNGDPEYAVNKESVEKALKQLQVDGKPYGERYGIEVNDSNLEATVSHMMHNLTQGEIGTSFHSNSPVRAVIVGEGETPEVTPLVPPHPYPHAQVKPPRLNAWARFWGMFGFFSYQRERYEDEMAQYQRQQKEIESYKRNETSMEDYAGGVERQEREKRGEIARVQRARAERERQNQQGEPVAQTQAAPEAAQQEAGRKRARSVSSLMEQNGMGSNTADQQQTRKRSASVPAKKANAAGRSGMGRH